MCYVCSMCNACGKVDRLRALNLTCPVCGEHRDTAESTCPHCGHGRPTLPGHAGVPRAQEAQLRKSAS